MTVRPVSFNPTNNSVEVLHEPFGHTGTVPLANVTFVDGLNQQSKVPDFMRLTCPVCGSETTHPVSGGADAPRVQELFVRQIQRMGCPCGQVTKNRPFAIVIAHVKTHVARQDGAERWQAGAIS